MIKIYNKDGVILNTKNKICTENLEITVDTADLTPENILKGKRILGVSGTAESGLTPTGTLEITTNGDHDVTNYAIASVNVPPTSGIIPKGTFEIEKNGIYDISTYQYADVEIYPNVQAKSVTPTKEFQTIQPDEGYDALNRVYIDPIPSRYIVPEGNIHITENGAIDIKNYATATINVEAEIPEGYILPSGNFEITQNGNYNISDKETVSVNVATGGGGEVDALWDDLMKSCIRDCNTSYLFRGRQLTSFDNYLAGYDTHQVTNTESMFAMCGNATSVPLFNTMSVSNMGNMFTCCYNVTSIPEYNTSNVTDMQHMFNSCYELTTIPQLDTGNVKNMTYMFANCKKLITIPQLNTSQVTNMTYTFANCYELDNFPQLDTSAVVDMSYMFQSCTALTSIQLNTIKAAKLSSLFRSCENLITADLTHINTSSSTYGNYMFYNCYSLKKVIIRNMTKAPTIGTGTFQNCYHIHGTVNATYNPDGAADGYVYVPDDMVATLKTATNWSTIATQIKPLSELEE